MVDDEMNKNFRDWVRFYRISQRFTTLNVAKAAGRNHDWLLRWERAENPALLEPKEYLLLRDFLAPGVSLREMTKPCPVKFPQLTGEVRRKAIPILEEERIKQGITDKDLAVRVGLTEKMWAMYTYLHPKTPSLSTIYLACKALNVDFNKLLKKIQD